jgi:hypothetical protein
VAYGRRYYGAEVRRLWIVIEKLTNTRVRSPSEKLCDAYSCLMASVGPDSVPESVRDRFKALCSDFHKECDSILQQVHFPQNDYILAARMHMKAPRVRYFVQSLFELCRDAIEAGYSED